MTPQDGTLWRNKKTGRKYWFSCAGTDCTNSRDGTTVAIYYSKDKRSRKIYVRELAEFLEKFEEIRE